MHQAYGTIYQHTLKGEKDGQRIHMVNHWAFKDLVDQANDFQVDVAAVANALVTRYTATLLNEQDEDFQLHVALTEAITAVMPQIGDEKAELVVEEQNEQHVGFGGGNSSITDPMPTFCAAGIRKLTDRKGRQFRGGTRLLCLDESDVIENTLEAARKTSIQNSATTYFGSIANIVGAGTNLLWPVVFARSRAFGLAAPDDEPAIDMTAKVTGVIVSPYVSSQVSRKRKQKSL